MDLEAQVRFNIIGDIHGRTVWKDLVRDDCVNIFVGDYFDPYDDISFNELADNFVDIINFANTYPDTILLLGNHDLHYLHGRESSRYDYENADKIRQLLIDDIHMFRGVTCALGNELLVSHAGVSEKWLESTGYDGEMNSPMIDAWCNELFWDGFADNHWDMSMRVRYFRFDNQSNGMDFYGTSPTQSPVWIRPQTLIYHNPLPKQVVGHTQVTKLYIPHDPSLILIDCLGQNPASLIVEMKGNEYNFIKNEKRDN